MKHAVKNINLPNILTIGRIVCIPVVLSFLLLYPDGQDGPGRLNSFFAGLFFGIASITDILDGYYARRYGTITTLGKFLDPLADKLLNCLTMICLIPLGRIPIWVVLIVISREIAVTGLRGIAGSEGIVFQASSLGKYKTIFQAASLAGLCIHYEFLWADTHVVGMFFLWPALFLTIYSGLDYFIQFRHALMK